MDRQYVSGGRTAAGNLSLLSLAIPLSDRTFFTLGFAGSHTHTSSLFMPACIGLPRHLPQACRLTSMTPARIETNG